MNRNNYIKDLNEIQKLTKQIKVLSESIAFNEDEYGDYDNGQGDEEMEGQTRLSQMRQDFQGGDPNEKPEDAGMRNLDQSGELDQIREITLKGMIKMCKNPEDPTYQALKKIFQMVDKGVEKEQKEQQQM